MTDYQRGYEQGSKQALSLYSDILHKNHQMPYNESEEQALLANFIMGFIKSIDERNNILDLLNPNDFYIRKNIVVYEAIKRLTFRNSEVSIIAVMNIIRTELKEEWSVLNDVEPHIYITNITNKVGYTTNLLQTAINIRKNAMARTLYEFCLKTANRIIDNADVMEVMNDITKHIESDNNINIEEDLRQQSINAIEVLKQKLEGKFPVMGYTGLDTLDMMMGLNKIDGALCFAYGKSGAGKSVLQNCIMLNCHIKNINVWANSAETPITTLLAKFIAASPELTHIVKDNPEFTQNGFNSANFTSLNRGLRANGKRYFDDVQVHQIITMARELVVNSSVICTNKTRYSVDKFLKTCKAQLTKGYRVFLWDRYELFDEKRDWLEIDSITARMRAFCVEHSCIIFCFVQLNKGNTEKMLDNVRGSAGIEHNSMICIGVERDVDNNVYFHLDKNSYGPTAVVGKDDKDRFMFLPNKQTFIQSMENGVHTTAYWEHQKEQQAYRDYIDRLNDPLVEPSEESNGNNIPF